ncbi:hypothetical protein BVRB_3g064040 [Beta vulgaris subsp. vulgaris]|nr:hypothetical protein BVRB_3g064040 [Beta vulgaris subsp. vulgaris]
MNEKEPHFHHRDSCLPPAQMTISAVPFLSSFPKYDPNHCCMNLQPCSLFSSLPEYRHHSPTSHFRRYPMLHLQLLLSPTHHAILIAQRSTFKGVKRRGEQGERMTVPGMYPVKWTSSSVYYILGLWTKMVTSVIDLKNCPANLSLDEYVPLIVGRFISARAEALQAGFVDDLSENPLDKVELMEDQLDFLPYLFRFQVFVNLESLPPSMSRDETVKVALIGLMRDLRGIAMATPSRKAYGFLFDWLYPAHMAFLQKAIATWADSQEVTIAVLKFVAELVSNKYHRLKFDISSPNGILLFREVSKLLVAYGSRNVTLSSEKDVYRTKYKGIWISLAIFTKAIVGEYVTFGVFELYGDKALDDALDIAMKMILSVPLTDLLAYKKVSKAYFGFIDAIIDKLINVTFNLEGTTFMFIIRSLYSGLQLLDPPLLLQCANIIDHLATFYFDHIIMGESPASPALVNFAQRIIECADIFLEMLKAFFDIYLFEHFPNQLSLSRPMLSLILLNEETYAEFKTQVIASQPVDEQLRALDLFDMLMRDVNRGLDRANRERFNHNLAEFKKEFTGKSVCLEHTDVETMN